MYGRPRRGLPPPFTWRGVKWSTISSASLPLGPVPPSVLPLLSHPLHNREPYASNYPAAYVQRDFPSFMRDPGYPLKLARVTDTCILIDNLFDGFNFAAAQGAFESAMRALRPPPALEREVDDWFSNSRVSPHACVGLHARIGDMAKDGWGFSHDCEWSPSFVVQAVKGLVARLGAPCVMVATDSWRSKCVRAVLRAFPDAIKVGSWGEGCHGSAFVQEVLARTAGFVGNGVSTFSGVIHSVRVGVHGHPVNTSVWPSLTVEPPRTVQWLGKEGRPFKKKKGKRGGKG